MAEEITATLVVRFGEVTVANTEQGFLIIALDDRSDGLNLGRSSFFAGQDIGFLVYKSSRVGSLSIFESAGNAKQVGNDTREITETIIFSNSDTAQLSFPAQGGFGHVWLGQSGGGITLTNQKELTLAAPATAVLEVTYNTSFTEYLLEDTPAEINGSANYTIVVTAVGQVT